MNFSTDRIDEIVDGDEALKKELSFYGNYGKMYQNIRAKL